MVQMSGWKHEKTILRLPAESRTTLRTVSRYMFRSNGCFSSYVPSCKQDVTLKNNLQPFWPMFLCKIRERRHSFPEDNKDHCQTFVCQPMSSQTFSQCFVTFSFQKRWLLSYWQKKNDMLLTCYTRCTFSCMVHFISILNPTWGSRESNAWCSVGNGWCSSSSSSKKRWVLSFPSARWYTWW